MHSAKIQELTEEQYNQVYNEYLTKYDVVRPQERPISMEAETVQ